LSNLD